jgi:serine/threonine protein phosphatase 1
MQNTYVIGDIHGAFLALQEVINKTPLHKTDTLIFLGDYVDGWSQPVEVLHYLIQLSKQYNCIFLRGNHDQLLYYWLTNQKQHIKEELWYKHGGEATVKAYQKADIATLEIHIAFLKNLKDFYIDNQNRLFVHAGFTNMHGVTHEYFPKLLYWDRTLWEMAVSLDKTIPIDSPKYPTRLKLYHEIFIGHTPTTKIEDTLPINAANIWNVDTGAAFKGPITMLNIDTKEFYQSTPAYMLYPEENGRN